MHTRRVVCKACGFVGHVLRHEPLPLSCSNCGKGKGFNERTPFDEFSKLSKQQELAIFRANRKTKRKKNGQETWEDARERRLEREIASEIEWNKKHGDTVAIVLLLALGIAIYFAFKRINF